MVVFAAALFVVVAPEVVKASPEERHEELYYDR